MSSSTRYALLGYPVKHSVSPQMQMAGFNKANIKASYQLIEVAPENLIDTFCSLRKTHRGWNITIPHKEESFHLVDQWDESARITSCVNTVINNDGILTGYSTDGYGMAKSLKESFHLNVKETHFTFIGAGGASHSVATYFASLGARHINIINRTYGKAENLAKQIKKLGCPSSAYSLDDKELSSILQETEVLIQGTNLGLKENDPLPFEKKLIPRDKYVVDMIYKDTKFLQIAKKNNCQAINGFGMLLYQGVKAWEIWTGQNAPVQAMQKALKLQS